jgi:serine/threonine protein phosphatase PrpC
MKKCLTDAFEEIHREVCASSEIDSHNSGSTLTVVIVESDQLYCANVGDSKAILIWDVKKPQSGKAASPDKNMRSSESQSGANITILTA